jgi:hypothetical protein
MRVSEAELFEPRRFDAMRSSIARNLTDPTAAVASLQPLTTPISKLRAAMLLGSSAPQDSSQLALTVKDDVDTHIGLMARLQLLKNETLRLWRGNDHPKPAARMCVRQLLEVLKELQGLEPDHPLHDEIRAYATSFAAEASLLAGNITEAERFALEARWHAEHVGMDSLAATAKFQLANIAIYQDQYELALTQLEASIADASLSPSQHVRAIRNRAVTLMLLGEETAALSSLEDGAGGDAAFLDGLKALTFRYRVDLESEGWLQRVPNTLGLQARCTHLIGKALSLAPTELPKRQALLRQAQRQLHDLMQTALGVSALEIKTLSALIALGLGSPALALRRLPALETLEKAPPAVGTLNTTVRISALLGLLPESATDLNDALHHLDLHLERLSASSLPQVLGKLQLLTPTALVLASRAIDFPDVGLTLADECLLNLKVRPISVYGIGAVRPTAAANLILSAFGRDVKQSDHLGGGQLESTRKALLRPFGTVQYWFQPVCAAWIAFALLCLRNTEMDVFQLNAAVRELRVRFGYIPHFQQAQPHPELETINTALILLERGEITAISAAKLLMGEGGRL